jgi:hypothetical protein
MDDPGGAQNAHLRSWAYSKLTEPQWGEIATDLAHRKARLSMAYVSGWVDDGDPSRGLLEVNGAPVPRIKGQVLPSPAVVYRSCSGMVQDGASEFRGIQALRASGLGDVELHGYTHMHPDLTAWASAEDRYDSVEWYRELGPSAEWILRTLADKDHPIALGLRALRRHFDVQPTTLISPGDQWTNTVLEFALRHGVQLIDSYYLAIRHDNRFCWSTHVCSPYLDEPDQSWFDSGLPTVGYFHDMEPSRHGAGWLTRCLDSWEQAGARRFIDFRELAGALSLTFHVSHNNGCFSLKVRQDSGPPLVRPVKLAVKTSNSGLPQTLWIQTETQEIDLRS